jgi:hypothetical protein
MMFSYSSARVCPAGLTCRHRNAQRAGFVSGANQRLAPLYGLLAQAGPEVTQLLATTQQERLTGVRALVTHLTGPRVFLDLTTDRGWQPGQYEDWLVCMLTANLLAPAT